MRTIFVICITLFVLSCSKPVKQEATVPTANPQFDSLLARYQEDFLRLFPLEATSAGDNRYNDILPNDLSQQYINSQKDFYTRYRGQLTGFDRQALPDNDKISYDALLWECDIALERLTFKEELLPINQFWSNNLVIGQLASGASIQPFKTVKDYENWLSRLNGYLAWCDTAIVNMRAGIKAGYVLPKKLAAKVIPQFAALDHGPVKDHLFYSPIKRMPGNFSDEDKARLTKLYTATIQDKIIPAHQKLKTFFQKEYLPAGRETSGINDIPSGKEYYAHLIKRYTTTTMTADEIFALGKSEVDRISKEMEAVKEQVGFKGDLIAFFEHIRTRKELKPFTKPEQVIAWYDSIHEKMKPSLAKLFQETPKTPFEVRRTEAFREASASAEYVGGSEDGTRPGIFYVPIPNVKEYSILTSEDLFLHEAIPGHHYQISIQKENTTLPAFRRFLSYSAFSEGWALYTESLGKELGLYTDPYLYFGMLDGEMHRAVRLVVDAGMHSQGWTREQAIQYSKDHEPADEAGIIAEIERYMAIPGQALSYKIGQLKIRALRQKAEQELKERFDISQFHTQVLEGGCIPLHVLEGKIDGWIGRKLEETKRK